MIERSRRAAPTALASWRSARRRADGRADDALRHRDVAGSPTVPAGTTGTASAAAQAAGRDSLYEILGSIEKLICLNAVPQWMVRGERCAASNDDFIE
jgi:hypothetical protein